MKKSIAIILLILPGAIYLTGCKFIINSLAFHPDTERILTEDQLPGNVRELFIETEDQVKLQSYFIPQPASNSILIYFHGNAGNVCSRLPDLMKIHGFGINVLGISYRGYGKSRGKPSEAGIYLDGEAAFKFASGPLGFSPKSIIIFGRSLGTAAALNTAQHKNISGLILVTPMTSGKDYARAHGLGFFASLAGDAFNNIARIQHIKCPLLVVHGTEDSVIPFAMGKAVFNNATVKKQFVEIEGAGHNNLSDVYQAKYWPPVSEFIVKHGPKLANP